MDNSKMREHSLPVILKCAALLPDVQLQPHQQQIADESSRAPVRKLLLHSLGSGKTLTSLAAAESFGEPYTAVTPASLRANYRGEQEKFTDQETPSTLLSYNQLGAGAATPHTGTVIFDECVPAGTLIDGRPIESIRPGDVVLSVNHVAGLIESKRVLRTACRLTDRVWHVETEAGSVVCTEDHPLYTTRGYVRARDIVFGDSLASVVVGCIECGHERPYSVDLCHLRNDIHDVASPVSRASETLLSGVSEEDLGCRYAQDSRAVRREDTRTDANEEPDARCDLSCRSLRGPAGFRTRAENSRRQRQGTDAAGGRDGYSTGLVYVDDRGDGDQAERRTALALQAGRGGCDPQDLHRDRREIPQHAGQTSPGPAEGRILGFARVVRVTVHQQGSGSRFEQLCPAGLVYDLTVEDNHNFFANGHLVHNSHRLRNPDSAQSQQAYALASRAKQLILLSGTPIVNQPSDLAPLISMLKNKHLPREEFQKRYVGMEKVYPNLFRRFLGVPAGEEPRVQNPEELKALLKGHVDYYDPGKSVVPTQYEDIHTEMGQEQSQLYNAMWNKLPWYTRWKLQNDFPLSQAELSRTLSFMTGPRQVSLSTYPYLKDKDPHKAFSQSPKLQRAMELMNKHLGSNPQAKALVFSNFIDAGLTPYAAALAKAGVPHSVFHGGLTDAKRKQLVNDYNEGKLRVALLGPSGTEGLSFKGTQLIQQLDPYWNPVRGKQAVGRGLRYDSHQGLPPELQNVRVQRFLSRLPMGLKDRMLAGIGFNRESVTHAADDHLRAMETRKSRLNQQFLDLLREVGSQKTAQGG